jgi:hypothetical protein
MTDMLAHGRTAGDQPNPHDDQEPSRNPQRSGDPGRGGRVRRLAGSIGYDVLLAPVGVLTMGDAVIGNSERAGRRWSRLVRLLPPAPATVTTAPHPVKRAPAAATPAAAATLPTPNVTAGSGRGRVFGYGLLSVVIGLASWFLVMLTVLAVVRGPFWGFVDHGPVLSGTWGGPTRTGAWITHGLIAVPCVILFLFALRGIAALLSRLVRPLYGVAVRRWVLPATIALAAGSVLFFWSWLQQL